jgi:hypothetical protein
MYSSKQAERGFEPVADTRIKSGTTGAIRSSDRLSLLSSFVGSNFLSLSLILLLLLLLLLLGKLG